MSKADDVFIRQFIVVLVLLAAYGVGAAVLGIWIAEDARDAAAGSERATLERIAPVGRVELGEPGARARAEGAGSESTAGAAAAASGGASAADAAAATVVAAASSGAAAGGGSGSAAADSGGEVGEAIYKRYCFACHLTGVAEAPPTGDTEAWAPRAALGFDALYRAVLDGKGAMPARAGFPHLSDDELKAGIRYLLAAANVAAE